MFEWWTKCHLAGKHSIFQHLLYLVRNRSKQWQIPCRPILQVLKDDQIYISAWPPAVTILLCSVFIMKAFQNWGNYCPAQNTKAQTEWPAGSTPKHHLYLRTCESLPSMPLTQGASQATGCGLGMCKSKVLPPDGLELQFLISLFLLQYFFLAYWKAHWEGFLLLFCFVWQDAGAIYCSVHHYCVWILKHLPGVTSPLLKLMGQKHTILARNMSLAVEKYLAKLSSSEFL